MATSTDNSLDRLIDYALTNHISTVGVRGNQQLEGCHFPYSARAVVIAPFAMQVHCHDTGNSVRVYILGAGKPYQIMSATYWKRSGYDHNKDDIEYGAWDAAFSNAQRKLAELVEAHRKSAEESKARIASSNAERAAVRKAEVEALFLGDITAKPAEAHTAGVGDGQTTAPA